MDTIHIYTISNWHLVRYLFPNGTWSNNSYIVYIDTDSSEYTSKLSKLRAVSPWLADQVAVWSDSNVCSFTVHCEHDYPMPKWKRG